MFHFTCDHGAKDILGMEVPAVIPAGMTRPDLFSRGRFRVLFGQVSWFTDLSEPFGNALGLRKVDLLCDRTENRLTVLPEDERLLTPWWRFRRAHPGWRELGAALEKAPGVMPMHWYVAVEPVRVQR